MLRGSLTTMEVRAWTLLACHSRVRHVRLLGAAGLIGSRESLC